ncbi:MAG TPA: DEAD/DEAH box helicase [Planctomycetota bacterium]|jgi:DEAD/DEAH box helicase domain-containing protein
MDAETFLNRLSGQRFFRSQMCHVEALPCREAVFGEVGELHPDVRHALAMQGIEQLYSHQAEAIAKVRSGANVVVVTGTASGKTLCYNIPLIEAALRDRLATALLIYPTKALTQDQLRGLQKFGDVLPSGGFVAGTYDGDTPADLRRKLRDTSNFLLTNPDMLHQGILPQHARWNRFFSYLKFVVIDEVHAYRGVFGSHLANVIRRLQRICRHYGASPQFICSSATIGNPKEHAERITGAPMERVGGDGAPRGPKRFVMWNPPVIQPAGSRQDAGGSICGRGDGKQLGHTPASQELRAKSNELPGGLRRSPLGEATHLMAALVQEGIQTIAFTRTRLAAELLYKSVRDVLREQQPRLAEKVRAYRGGYLPEERRKIEKQLAAREILGVASTNALELGIDIGSLDACIIVGYPGTIASLWQQAGRAGRGKDESLVFLVGQNSPIDQYFMSHSGYLFAQSPEHAIVDPDNPHIAIDHVRCAVAELPLKAGEAALFGPFAQIILDLLAEDQLVRKIDEQWYWAMAEYPAAKVNLRNIAGPVYTIQERVGPASLPAGTTSEKVIGTLDEVSALNQLHTHAVYLHGGETYFVEQLDLDKKIAHVERRDLDYYTQSVQVSQIQIEPNDAENSTTPDSRLPDSRLSFLQLGFGDVTVTTSTPMFRKTRFHSRDSLGFEKIDLPPQVLETVALWLSPNDAIAAELRSQNLVMGEALLGIANAMAEMAQMFVMCDAQDIGTVVDARCLGRDALFLYDRYPGGMGYARRCCEQIEPILRAVQAVIKDCGCEDGCPSCVGAAVPAYAMTDLDSSVRDRIPSKQAASVLLDRLLARD